MATTGIAANLLPQGRTCHSRLNVPVQLTAESLLKIKPKSPEAELIRESSIFIVDEVTMGHKHLFECIDRSFRDIRNCQDKPFGGAIFIVSGDWRQCLPVIPMARRAEITNATLKCSHLWENVQVFKLTTNMRIINAGQDNKKFAQYLKDIGEGKIEINTDQGEYSIKIPEEFKSKASTLKEFVLEVFEDIKQKVKDGVACQGVREEFDKFIKWMVSRAIIVPRNDDAEEINRLVMDELDTPAMVYRSADRLVHQEQAPKYTDEFLNGLSPSSVPPHVMVLKEGSMIMLMRNMDAKRGHVNGARYIVRKLKPHVILAELAEGPYKGNEVAIPRFIFIPEDPRIPIEWHRKQFPVKPCFAITSNKSQGQTLQKIGIYVKNDFFGHGQLYVAMSRVGNPQCLQFFKPPPLNNDKKKKSAVQDLPLYVSNVVYPEVLSK